jgi:hypothetical protein
MKSTVFIAGNIVPYIHRKSMLEEQTKSKQENYLRQSARIKMIAEGDSPCQRPPPSSDSSSLNNPRKESSYV